MNWQEYSKDFDEFSIEIGFGTSCILPRLADIDSKTLFIGVEIVYKFCFDLINKLQVDNIVIINTDIRKAIKSVPDQCICNYYVFFPSPPVEERIFSNEFHIEILRTLKKGGVIKVVTDDRRYYEYITDLFSENNWVHLSWTPMPFIATSSDLLVGTDCEIEYCAKYYLECCKR